MGRHRRGPPGGILRSGLPEEGRPRPRVGQLPRAPVAELGLGRVLSQGDEIDVTVVEVDRERGRIGLRRSDDPAVVGKSKEELAAVGSGDRGPRGGGGRDRGRGGDRGGRGGRDRGRGGDRERRRRD